jgi:hypothetical protein
MRATAGGCGLTTNTPSCRQSWRPLRLGPTGHIQRRPSPVGGGSAGYLEMAETLISTRLLEIISSRYAENAKRPGKRYFQTSKAFPRIWTRSRRVNIAGRSSGGQTNATTNNKPGEHLRASRPRLLLIHGFGRLFNAGCYDQGCLRPASDLIDPDFHRTARARPPLGIKVERSRFSSFAASRVRR